MPSKLTVLDILRCAASVAKGRGLGICEIEDLRQEAALAAVLALSSYDANRGASELTFAWVAARNAIGMALRREGLRMHGEIIYDICEQGDKWRDLRLDIKACIERLAPAVRIEVREMLAGGRRISRKTARMIRPVFKELWDAR